MFSRSRMKAICPVFHELTESSGVDIVIESSGHPAGIASAMLLAAKGGAVVLLGIPYGDVAFPRLNFEKNHPQ